MFKHILVPLDGSERAEQAIPVAARIARAGNGVVSLLRIIEMQQWYGPYMTPPDGLLPPGGWTPYSTANAQREEAEAYLKGRASSPTLASIETSITVREGSPAWAILDEIDIHHVDLVVLSSHGRSGLPRWALGSVAEHIARHATAPVLVLREESPQLESAQQLRALVPLDGSARARAALAPAVDLLVALTAPAPAELHLVLVAPPYVVEEHNMPYALMLEGAKSYLARVADDVQKDAENRIPLSVTWSIATDTDFANGIIDVAENRASAEGATGAEVRGKSDLIVMATHGYSGIARMAMGSVAEHVLHGTRLPLLIVRPEEMAERQRGFPAQTSATNA